MIRNPGEHVGEPGAGVDIVQLAGLDQSVNRGCTPRARVRTAERPVLAPDRDAAYCALGGVVAHADGRHARRTTAGQ